MVMQLPTGEVWAQMVAYRCVLDSKMGLGFFIYFLFLFFIICKRPGLPVIGNALTLSVFVIHVTQC